MILILDALDQLEDHDQAPDLVWLPTEIPSPIRMIVSTLPGRALNELERRKWPTLTIEPLQEDERRRMIRDLLALSRKRLSAEREARIVASPRAANPLFLHTLLEELRLVGDHARLDQQIGYYLEVEGIDDLFGKRLERFERDYEGDRPGLVREAFSAIWAVVGACPWPNCRRYWAATDNLSRVLGFRPFFSPLKES